MFPRRSLTPLSLLSVVAGEQSRPRRRETALTRRERRLRARQGDRARLEDGGGQGEAGCRDRFQGCGETRNRYANLHFVFSSRVSLMKISVPELIWALSLIQLLPHANSRSRPCRPRRRAHRTTAPARLRARA